MAFSLPDFRTPDKDKDYTYHLNAINSIAGNVLTPNYMSDYAIMDESYKFFNNQQAAADRFKYLTESENGEAYPATWFSINQIRTKLRVLVGELMQRGYDFDVRAINKEAKARKIQAMEEMRVDMRLQNIAQQLEAFSGLPTAQQGYLPQSEEELENYFQRDYRELAEIVIYYALKFLEKRNYWTVERKMAFLDLLIAGKCFVKNEVVNGMPVARRVDPRDIFYDPFSQDDLLRDSTFWGERRYMSIADAAERYGLSHDDLKNLAKQYEEYSKVGAGQRNQLSFSFAPTSKGLEWFKSENGTLRVMVLEAVWQDTKELNQKVWVDKYGNEHRKRTRSQRSKEGEFEIEKKRVKIWRQATLIGGQIMKQWGIMPNQQRYGSPELLHEAEPPYVGLIPDFVDGQAVSIVEQVKSLQNLKDIFAYNMQMVVSVAGVPGFVYDVAQAPKDWQPEDVIYYLRKTGIAFINSKQNGTPAQFNQFQKIDLSLSQSVTKYLELIAWCDNQIDLISGINEARQGVVQGASQAVGVTRSALLQSNMVTAPLFSLFDTFSSRVWNQQARLVKLTWAKKEKYAPIIGDVGVNFLKQDIDLSDDFAIFVEATPRMLDDINNFQQLVMTALNAGKLDFLQAMTLLKEKDVVIGMEKFRKMQEDQQEKEMQMQQQLMAQQEQMKQEGQQRMLEANQMSQQAALQNQIALQGMKGQQAMQQELLSQRGEMIKETLNSNGSANNSVSQ